MAIIKPVKKRKTSYVLVFGQGMSVCKDIAVNGVYFYRLEVIPEGEGDDYRATRKLVVLI